MKKNFDLTFCFKGSRRYVHGTDIFSKLTEQCDGNPTDIDLVFHGITASNMIFSVDKPSQDELKVVFRCSCGHEMIRLFGVENGQKIDCNYAYAEERIVKNSELDLTQKSINMLQSSDFLFIEHIVAMNKTLVETLYNNVKGKWYFTRLQLERNYIMDEVLSLEVRLQSNFQLKLTKSLLIVNGLEVGYLYFSNIPEKA